MANTVDDPNDPAAQLRKRITAQVSGDPNAPQLSVSDRDPPAAPAPFDATPSQPPREAPLPAPVTPQIVNGAARQGVTDPPFVSPPAPAAPTQAGPTIPTNPDGSQVGGGTPWTTGPNGHPAYAPPGYHWDDNLAMFQPGQDTNRPTGGNLSDPAFRKSFIAWAATQPGVNPSVQNDPNYWDQAFASGRFGNDQEYALKRMMQAEGAPEGAGGGAGMPNATSPFTEQVRKLLMDRMGRDTAAVDENDPYIKQPMDAANLQAQREQQTERTALAERAAASGDTSASVNMGIQQSAERNAVGLGTFKGKLMQQLYESKRADLNDAMQQALASGDRETATQLQMALAQLDAQLRREGLGVNLAEYGQDQNNKTVGAGL